MRIQGEYPSRIVRVDGVILHPRRSQRVWNHSPDGFNWGYAGSGPAQLALALLLHAGLGEHTATRLHQHLKRDLVERLAQAEPFDVAFDLEAWIDTHALCDL